MSFGSCSLRDILPRQSGHFMGLSERRKQPIYENALNKQASAANETHADRAGRQVLPGGLNHH